MIKVKNLPTNVYPLKIKEKIPEAKDSVSFILEPLPEYKNLFHYKPAQFLTFYFEMKEKRILRSYSLSSCPLINEHLKTTVKRVTKGVISNYMIDHLKEGDIVYSRKPAGKFFKPPTDLKPKHYFLFAGGSGITPLFSIIKTALLSDPKNQVTLFYANKNASSVIYQKELSEWSKKYKIQFKILHLFSQPEKGTAGTASLSYQQASSPKESQSAIMPPLVSNPCSGGTVSLADQRASSPKESQSAIIPPLVSNPRSGAFTSQKERSEKRVTARNPRSGGTASLAEGLNTYFKGRLTKEFLEKYFSSMEVSHRHHLYYLCGPEGFMQTLKEFLTQKEVHKKQVQVESFLPARPQGTAGSATLAENSEPKPTPAERGTAGTSSLTDKTTGATLPAEEEGGSATLSYQQASQKERSEKRVTARNPRSGAFTSQKERSEKRVTARNPRSGGTASLADQQASSSKESQPAPSPSKRSKIPKWAEVVLIGKNEEEGTASLADQQASSPKESQSAIIPPLVSNPRSGAFTSQKERSEKRVTARNPRSGGTASLADQQASSPKESQSAIIPPLVSNPRSGGTASLAEEGTSSLAKGKITSSLEKQPEKIKALLNGELVEIVAKEGIPILEQLLSAGHSPPFSCLAGSCMSCMAVLKKGLIFQEERGILEEENLKNYEILTCQAKPVSSLVEVDYDHGGE